MIKIKEKIVFALEAIIIPLAIGGVIYYILCPEVYFVKIIDFYTGINMHVHFNIQKHMIIRMIRNYLLDYLWAFAFTNALFLTFKNDTNALPICCLVSIFVGLILEMTQLFGIVYGTFDILDLITEILAAISAIIIITIRRKRNEKN